MSGISFLLRMERRVAHEAEKAGSVTVLEYPRNNFSNRNGNFSKINLKFRHSFIFKDLFYIFFISFLNRKIVETLLIL